jgi:hypothetical protein
MYHTSYSYRQGPTVQHPSVAAPTIVTRELTHVLRSRFMWFTFGPCFFQGLLLVTTRRSPQRVPYGIAKCPPLGFGSICFLNTKVSRPNENNKVKETLGRPENRGQDWYLDETGGPKNDEFKSIVAKSESSHMEPTQNRSPDSLPSCLVTTKAYPAFVQTIELIKLHP